MKPSSNIESFIRSFEGLELNAYPDGNVFSIGYGNTYYADGSPVRAGDTISTHQAEMLFRLILERDFASAVNNLVIVPLNQNQFDALCSFAYNLGIGNLRSSTLLLKVNKNPNDPEIADEFKRWIYAGGRVLNGLVRRRNAEAELYFSPLFQLK